MTVSTAWERAALARDCFLVAPELCRGIWLRARAGPIRDRFLEPIVSALRPRKIHPSIDDEALFGGVDVAASLVKGAVVTTTGLLADAACLSLSMAERATPGLAARLGAALDKSVDLSLICVDEGAEADEAVAPSLAERLALHIDLNGIALGDTDRGWNVPRIEKAKGKLAKVAHDDEALHAVTHLAAQLGVASLRVPIMALNVARICAALRSSNTVDADDLAAAAALVLAPRATQMPAQPEEEREPEPPQPPDVPPEEHEAENSGATEAMIPDEMLLDAVTALLPKDLLDRLAAQRAARAMQSSAGAGAKQRGNRRGRPLPARPGKPGSGARVDLISTLRRAAPWQTIRRASSGRDGLQIRSSDIQLKQFEECSDRAIIFVVDASGSAALARLAEAKGAVELLLAQAYARRDYVALIAFRGDGADLLLPPTRSLVQTKRRLAALPGGGGTPLAAGLQDALTLAETIRNRGMSPALAVLTDGRANVALDGSGNRALAGDQAQQMARMIRSRGIPAVIIDTGLRPSRGLDVLAHEMGAGYLPLPRADAAALSSAVETSLGAA